MKVRLTHNYSDLDRRKEKLLKTKTVFNKLQYLLSLGIDVSFKRSFNMFEIILSKDDLSETVTLPFDHLNEKKIISYIDLLEEKIN